MTNEQAETMLKLLREIHAAVVKPSPEVVEPTMQERVLEIMKNGKIWAGAAVLEELKLLAIESTSGKVLAAMGALWKKGKLEKITHGVYKLKPPPADLIDMIKERVA